MARHKRARTAEEKRVVVERLYAAWLKVPDLRLGQLVANAVGGDVFYAEDGALADDVEAYTYPRRKEGT